MLFGGYLSSNSAEIKVESTTHSPLKSMVGTFRWPEKSIRGWRFGRTSETSYGTFFILRTMRTFSQNMEVSLWYSLMLMGSPFQVGTIGTIGTIRTWVTLTPTARGCPLICRRPAG